MTRILVTGATGFVGRALVDRLRSGPEAADVVVLTRRGRPADPGISAYHADLLSDAPLPAEAFKDVDAVIHLAGWAHRGEPKDAAERASVRAVNRDGALAVARKAADAGVGRFVFVSTVGVHGPGPFAEPIGEDAPLRPETTYAESKAEAEDRLRALAEDSGLPLCIVRPPLVYGPEAPGNFARLMAWARNGHPMPSAARDGVRSMVAVRNLCDALLRAADHPAAPRQTFFVADAEDISTGELYVRLCHAHGRAPRFLPVPRAALIGGLSLLGRGSDAARLLSPYRLNTRAIRHTLGWDPPYSIDDEIARAVRQGSARDGAPPPVSAYPSA